MTQFDRGMVSPSSGLLLSPKSKGPEFGHDLLQRYRMKQTLDIIFKSDDACKIRADLGQFNWGPEPKPDGVKVQKMPRKEFVFGKTK